MTFLYRYQTGNRVEEGRIKASSEADAYSLLRKSGVRPMKVWPAPGVFNRIAALGKRGAAIILLSFALLVAVYLALRTPHEARGTMHEARVTTHDPQGTKHEARGTMHDPLFPLPRQQVPPVDVEFKFVSERTLAAFARPGDTSGLASMSNTAAVLLADLDEAVLRPVPVDAADGADAERLKRIVNGMKSEIGMSLRCGDTKDVILARLIERQKMEAAYRERAVENVRRHHDALQSCNETLRVMSLKEITVDEL